MNKLCLTAASTALFLVSGVAAAQEDRTDRMAAGEPAQECLDELDRVKQQYDQAQLSGDVRNEVDQLSESARILGESGREDACNTMVETISSITEEGRQGQDQGQMQEQDEMQVLQNAKRVTDHEGIVKASTIAGTTIRNMQNEELGTIEDTVIDPQSGEVSYVVLSVGGFLGVGERLVALPWKELRVAEAADGQDTFYVVDAPRDYLEQRESLSGEDWPEELKDEWQPSQ